MVNCVNISSQVWSSMTPFRALWDVTMCARHVSHLSIIMYYKALWDKMAVCIVYQTASFWIHLAPAMNLCVKWHHLTAACWARFAVIVWCDVSVFNDGTRKELLCLDGTVPVPYKGTSTLLKNGTVDPLYSSHPLDWAKVTLIAGWP